MRLAKLLLLLVLAIGCVGYGVAIGRYEIFPYPLLERASSAARRVLAPVRAPAREQTKSVPRLDLPLALPERSIASALLPLTLRGMQLAGQFDIAATAGGIAVAGQKVLIADRVGRFYLYDNEAQTLSATGYPPIPNNVDQFHEWGRFGTSKRFRVHDVEYVAADPVGRVLVTHEFFDPELETTRLALSLLEVDPASLESGGAWTRIFESTPLPAYDQYYADGAGGRMARRDGRTVFLTVGDYNQDGVFLEVDGTLPAQDPSSDFGTVLELDLLTRETRTVSRGNRNAQGLAFTGSGELFATEHGPRGGDELNRIQAGRNYGWPTETLGLDYFSYSWPPGGTPGRHDQYEAPIHAWLPSIGVSNLIEVRNLSDRWNGDLLVSSLKSSSLYRIRITDGRVLYEEPIWIGERIRDIAQLDDGTVVLWTDATQLMLLSVDAEALQRDQFSGVARLTWHIADCMKCHHFGMTDPSHPAPTLTGLLGRRFGSDENFEHYSSAFDELEGVWSEEKLMEFLAAPSDFAPGTTMAIAPVDDPAVAKEIVAILKRAN